MPRDANGNYTLPSGNPVVTDTNIESVWANTTMQDIGAEMTDSLSRSGKGALTGPLQIIDEQTGVPGLAFGAEPTSGLKRSGSGDVRMQVQGSDRMRWRAGAAQVPEVQVSGVWREVALEEASSKFLKGIGGETTLYFYNLTVPAAAGWSPANPDGNIRNLTIGGTGGTIGGSEDPTNTPVNTTVSVAGTADDSIIPPGAITISGTASATALTFNVSNSAPLALTVADVAHTHNVSGFNTGNVTVPGQNFNGSGGGTGTITPRYAVGILGVLDA